MNNEWILESLTIRFNEYGDFKGRHTGKVTFKNKAADGFTFNLSPDETDAFIRMLEPKIVASASQLGSKLLSSLKMLPPAPAPVGEYISHEPSSDPI